MLAALVAIRREAGLTQRQLALRAGRPQSWIAKIEIGDRTFYLIDLFYLASGFGLPFEKFIKRFFARPEMKEAWRLAQPRNRTKVTLDSSWQMLITSAHMRRR
jgi:transcriptional regulator with XRE-family HTH domain